MNYVLSGVVFSSDTLLGLFATGFLPGLLITVILPAFLVGLLIRFVRSDSPV